MPSHFKFRHENHESGDGNEVYSYLPKGRLLSGPGFRGFEDRYSR